MEEWGFSKVDSKGKQEHDLLLEYLRDSTIPYVISQQIQTAKYYYAQLVFGFTPSGMANLFYRKSDGRSFFFKETIEGIKLYPLFFNDEFVLCLASGADLDSYRKVLNEEENKKIADREEDDNPVLIKCYYK